MKYYYNTLVEYFKRKMFFIKNIASIHKVIMTEIELNKFLVKVGFKPISVLQDKWFSDKESYLEFVNFNKIIEDFEGYYIISNDHIRYITLDKDNNEIYKDSVKDISFVLLENIEIHGEEYSDDHLHRGLTIFKNNKFYIVHKNILDCVRFLGLTVKGDCEEVRLRGVFRTMGIYFYEREDIYIKDKDRLVFKNTVMLNSIVETTTFEVQIKSELG